MSTPTENSALCERLSAPVAAASSTPTEADVTLAEALCPLSERTSLSAYRDAWVKTSAELIRSHVNAQPPQAPEPVNAELLDVAIWHRDGLDMSNYDFFIKHGFNIGEVIPRTRAAIARAESALAAQKGGK